MSVRPLLSSEASSRYKKVAKQVLRGAIGTHFARLCTYIHTEGLKQKTVEVVSRIAILLILLLKYNYIYTVHT